MSNTGSFLVLIPLQKCYLLSINNVTQIYSHNENSNKTFELLGFIVLALELFFLFSFCISNFAWYLFFLFSFCISNFAWYQCKCIKTLSGLWLLRLLILYLIYWLRNHNQFINEGSNLSNKIEKIKQLLICALLHAPCM